MFRQSALTSSFALTLVALTGCGASQSEQAEDLALDASVDSGDSDVGADVQGDDTKRLQAHASDEDLLELSESTAVSSPGATLVGPRGRSSAMTPPTSMRSSEHGARDLPALDRDHAGVEETALHATTLAASQHDEAPLHGALRIEPEVRVRFIEGEGHVWSEHAVLEEPRDGRLVAGSVDGGGEALLYLPNGQQSEIWELDGPRSWVYPLERVGGRRSITSERIAFRMMKACPRSRSTCVVWGSPHAVRRAEDPLIPPGNVFFRAIAPVQPEFDPHLMYDLEAHGEGLVDRPTVDQALPLEGFRLRTTTLRAPRPVRGLETETFHALFVAGVSRPLVLAGFEPTIGEIPLRRGRRVIYLYSSADQRFAAMLLDRNGTVLDEVSGQMSMYYPPDCIAGFYGYYPMPVVHGSSLSVAWSDSYQHQAVHFTNGRERGRVRHIAGSPERPPGVLAYRQRGSRLRAIPAEGREVFTQGGAWTRIDSSRN